jgi:plasmid stabilization system protein ParE
MRYEFHPEALEVYDDAARRYAEHEPALALRFIEAVEDAIRRVLEAPTRWPVIDEPIRSARRSRDPVHLHDARETDR